MGGVQTRPMSVEELTQRSTWVFRGRVLEMTCRRTVEGRVYTEASVRVLDAWKGHPGTNVVAVVFSGGVLGRRRSVVPDQVEFSIGEEVVIFTVRNPRGEAVCVGLDQGKFTVQRVAGAPQAWVVNRYHGLPEAGGPIALTSIGTRAPRRWTLEELAGRVRSAAKS